MSSPWDDDALWQQALEIHVSAIVIDGHNDIAGCLTDENIPISADLRGQRETDLTRMQQGGLTGQFFAVWVDQRVMTDAETFVCSQKMIETIHQMVATHANEMLLATRADDVRRAKREGKIAALIGIEGGFQIDSSLENLQLLYNLGARYMTLTWALSTNWADASGSPFGTHDADLVRHNGLAPFGREVIREMNRLGMMVDVSHASDTTVAHCLEESNQPIIASHSGARAIHNGPRNLPDELIRDIAANGGIVMVNFASMYLEEGILAETKQWWQSLEAKDAAIIAAHPEATPERHAAMRALRFEEPRPTAALSTLIDHIDRIVEVAGIDHVGLGSDYDGGIIPPRGLEDVSKYPVITHELLKRGYSPDEIQKVLGENILRVMETVDAASGQ
ncbi:MAG: dipeptidase [Chthonomonadales bacterium]